MFENNIVVNQYGTHKISRYIASYSNVTGKTAIQIQNDEKFARFLREVCHFSDEDLARTSEMLTGKFEIENDLKLWLANNKSENKVSITPKAKFLRLLGELQQHVDENYSTYGSGSFNLVQKIHPVISAATINNREDMIHKFERLINIPQISFFPKLPELMEAYADCVDYL